MLLPIVLGVVLIGFVILSIVLHPIRTALRMANRIIFLAILVLALLGVFIVQDAKNFRDALASGDILVVLEVNGTRTAGFAIHATEPAYFSDQELRSTSYKDYDRAIILSLEGLRDAGLERVHISNDTRVRYDAAERVLLSEDDRIGMAEEFAPELGVEFESLKNAALQQYELGEPKGMVLSAIYAEAYAGENMLIVIHMKRSFVRLEPTGMLSWAIRSTPESWLNSAAKVVP